MKFFKRVTLLVLAVVMMVTMVGCGGNENGGSNEITKLKMILVGEKPALYDEIYGKINEMLREDIGAEVEVEYYNYSDLNQKYSLLFSTGEEFDIVFAANWVSYNQQASKNSFMEITDEMLKKNAPKTYETLTETQKNEAKVNGKMYMIPNTALEYSNLVALIRGDLREKYGMAPLETVDDFEKYLENVAKNDKNITPLVNVAAVSSFWCDSLDQKARISVPKSTELSYDVDTDEFEKRDFQDYYQRQVTSIKKADILFVRQSQILCKVVE